MDPFASLRAETESLCLDVERLAQQLKARTAAFDDVNQLWRSEHQPNARRLNDVMVEYVPDSDPRILVEFRGGNPRQLKSSDRVVIDGSLSEYSAADHLELICRKLRELTTYLPSDSSA
jgi:hypothetical protein